MSTEGATDAARAQGATDRGLTRRSFVSRILGFAVISTVAMVAAPVIGFLIPPRQSSSGAGGRLLAGTTEEIVVGRSKVVALGSAPVIVLNTELGVKAFSAVCTHLGCIVAYDASRSPDIVSPCHDGHFSVRDGSVISGPPPAPLAEYAVAVEDNEIFVLSG